MIKHYCDKCGKQTKTPRNFSYRYTDSTRKYKNSGRYIIHTGRQELCAKCFKGLINLIN